MKKAAPALVAALLLVATACGGGNSSSAKPTGQEKTVIGSMVKVITTPTGLLDAAHAECVATKFVTGVGVKKLQSVKAVGADDQYVANGALVDAPTSAAYTKALVGCVKESDVQAKLVASAESGYGAQTQGVLASNQVSCLISTFVDSVGVAKVFSSQFVSDTGEFNGAGSAYDDETATKFADALLGCVDYPKLQAQGAAATNKKLDVGKLAACLGRKIPEADVKASIVARLTGAPNADTLLAATKKKSDACEKVSKK